MLHNRSWFFLSFSPAELLQLVAGPERTKNLAGKPPPPDAAPLSALS
jgi:hypothetical protein